VIGKYHPHGDTAVYDTIVRMAQDFSLRHMLVDGQGNFGSVDGDNAAAMRYTEIRLAKIAHEMLADIDKETVDFGPNYDGSEKEPLVLPARLPNLLINGSAGIAVGMATNIPPHNLNEVVDACLHLLKSPQATIEELMEIIPAPDFPTAGIIYGIEGVREGYRTGRGKVVMRAKCHFEDIDKGARQSIIVDEIPYQVNKKTLLERIAELVNDKKIEGISHIQDESDKSGMRVVIELKRGEVPEVVLNNLYKQTQLQDTFGINMVALIDGQPKLCNLKQLIEIFLEHRREVVTRRTVFELRKARERGHVLEGLAVALANIDEFIETIKTSPTPPVAKAALMSKSWDSSLVREMLPCRGRHTWRSGLPPGGPAGPVRHAARRPVSPVRRPGGRNPADAPAAPDRSGAGQDHRRVQGRDGRDRRSAGHPGHARARVDHHRRRAAAPPPGIRPDQARRTPLATSSTTRRSSAPKT
jgi:DNA gyrase subunit A